MKNSTGDGSCLSSITGDDLSRGKAVVTGEYKPTIWNISQVNCTNYI